MWSLEEEEQGGLGRHAREQIDEPCFFLFFIFRVTSQ